MGTGEQHAIGKTWDINLIAKVISAIALIIPLQYGLIFFMVEAKTDSLRQTVEQLTAEARKGARFTQHDGDRLDNRLDRHGESIAQIHKNDADLRELVAEIKVQQANVLYRLNRLEDLVQVHDHHGNSTNGKRRWNGRQSEIEKESWNGPMDLCDFVPCLKDINVGGEQC